MENFDKSIEEKFFFSMSESELYDATIQLTVPFYNVVHKTLIDVLKYHFGIAFGTNPNKIRGNFLDVGAGTGKESLSVLKTFPNLNVYAVDISPKMKEEFTDNYVNLLDDEKKRMEFKVADIRDLTFPKDLKDLPDSLRMNHRVCALSAYCIHHYNLDEKAKIYQKMFDFLEPGGILINIDLFNYKSTKYSEYADHFDIEFIKEKFNNPPDEFKQKSRLNTESLQKLKTLWINHYQQDNCLDPVETQMEILEQIGFKDVECIFKYFQQGVIVGTK